MLFYGNEWILLTFDLMLFTFVDLICNDYLLAAVVTGLAAQVNWHKSVADSIYSFIRKPKFKYCYIITGPCVCSQGWRKEKFGKEDLD